VWLLAETMTAGLEKLFHGNTKIVFLAAARGLDRQLPDLQQKLAAARSAGGAEAIVAADKAVNANRVLRVNNRLAAGVAGAFLVLVSLILLLSVREWVLLLARKRLARLSETSPAWLPEYAVAEGKPLGLM